MGDDAEAVDLDGMRRLVSVGLKLVSAAAGKLLRSASSASCTET